MIRHLVAVAATTTLLVTAVPATQAVATSTATCTKHVLPLPVDSVTGSSSARTADPSGRFVLGEANRDGRMHPQAVLWVDGEPRWLASQPEGESFAYSVIKGGLVLGTTSNADGTEHWIYSATTGQYRTLDVPENFRIRSVSAMNNNQDIVGSAYDENFEHQFPFIWPAGGQPRALAVPAGTAAVYVDDISDERRIIARLTPSEGWTTSYLWESPTARPAKLRAVHQETVWARDIEGRWIAGQESDGDNTTGLIWNTRNSRIVQLDEGVVDLNSSRDAVTAGSFGPMGEWPSTIVRSDGTKITFPEGTLLHHIFERTNQWTAAGYTVDTGELVPVLYACNN